MQINGKIRDRFIAQKGASKESLEAAARAIPRIVELLAAQTLKKCVVVPDKLVNFVCVSVGVVV